MIVPTLHVIVNRVCRVATGTIAAVLSLQFSEVHAMLPEQAFQVDNFASVYSPIFIRIL